MRFSSFIASIFTIGSLSLVTFASPATPSNLTPAVTCPTLQNALPVTDSSLRIINTTTAAASSGPLSQGIIAGDLIFVSGQLPIDPKTGGLIGFEGQGNITAQTKAVLANIKGIVEATGSSVGKIITCKVYLKNISDFDAMNGAYGEFFGNHKPTRLTVAVSALSKNALLEIEAIARL